MNNPRRKALKEIIAKIEGVQEELEIAIEELEEIKGEEEEYIENIPENLQGGERYERAETALDALESALECLQEIDLDEVVEQINEAVEA